MRVFSPRLMIAASAFLGGVNLPIPPRLEGELTSPDFAFVASVAGTFDMSDAASH